MNFPGKLYFLLESEVLLTTKMRSTFLYLGSVRLWKIVAELKSHFILWIHSIESTPLRKRYIDNGIPKLKTALATWDCPWPGTGLSVIRPLIDRNFSKFLLNFCEANEFISKPPIYKTIESLVCWNIKFSV